MKKNFMKIILEMVFKVDSYLNIYCVFDNAIKVVL